MHVPQTRVARAAGWTLLEALVVMAVLGLLLSLAAPALSGLRQQHQLQAQAEALLDSLRLARSEALRRQQRVTVCARANDGACDASGAWPQGWLVFADSNDNAQRDADEPLLEVRGPLPAALRLKVSSTVRGYFSYSAEGRSQSTQGAFMAGTWSFCKPGTDAGWQVVSNALGKPRLQKYSPEGCV